MTELSFGEVFNTLAIDTNSIVNLSHCPEAVPYLEQTVGYTGHTVFFSDNYGDREFAVFDGSSLRIYTVTTSGTPAITLLSTTTVTPPSYLFRWFGIKKINSSLYYIYYTSTNDWYLGTADYIKFGRVAVVPGGSSTNTVLESFPLIHSYYLWIADIKIIGRTAYVAWLREYTMPYEGWHLDVHIYSLDMDTETCSGGVVYQTPGTITISPIGFLPPDVSDLNIQFRFVESSGAMIWCTAYKWTTLDSLSNGTRIVINGVDTEIGYINVRWFRVSAYQYNSIDYLIVIDIQEYPTNLYRIKIPNGAIGSPVLNPSETIIVPVTLHFGSLAIGYDAGYYWIDKTTGLATSAVSVSGATLHDIFPTPDSYSGQIYMSVSISGVQKIISTDGYSIDKIYDVVLPVTNSAPNDFNHGNFFVQTVTSSAMYVTYLINLTAPRFNIVQMIID